MVARRQPTIAIHNLPSLTLTRAYNSFQNTAMIRRYRMASEQGNAAAQSNLGFMYDSGRGVPQSDTEAVFWYRKAAEQGHVFAQSNLGTMCVNGRGTPQSDTEAVKWYELLLNPSCLPALQCIPMHTRRIIDQKPIQTHIMISIIAQLIQII